MTKTVEYRVVPHDRWTIVRYHSEQFEDGGGSVGSEQRGEFANEKEANEVAALLAKADEGAVFISRASLNRPASGAVLGGKVGPIGGGGLSKS